VLPRHTPGFPRVGRGSAECGRGSLWGVAAAQRGKWAGDVAGRTPRHPRCLPRYFSILCCRCPCPLSHRVIDQVLDPATVREVLARRAATEMDEHD
jgi:hypothetical protein